MMTYDTPEALRMAIEARIGNISDETGIAVDRLRRRLIFQRVVARLQGAEPGQWVVKGGMAMETRLGDRARLTKEPLSARFHARHPDTPLPSERPPNPVPAVAALLGGTQLRTRRTERGDLRLNERHEVLLERPDGRGGSGPRTGLVKDVLDVMPGCLC